MSPFNRIIFNFVEGKTRVTCAEVAAGVAISIGYEPSLALVSRALANLAWDKIKIDGKVGYLRNERSHR